VNPAKSRINGREHKNTPWILRWFCQKFQKKGNNHLPTQRISNSIIQLFLSMKNFKLGLFILGIFFLAQSHFSISKSLEDWGFFAHREINKMAIFSLPPEMIVFYKEHIRFITDHAIDPDKRRYASKYEAVRHYLDLDIYGEPPFDNLPRNWVNALMAYSDIFVVNGRDTFLLRGENFENLSDAESITFSEKFYPDISISRDSFRGFFIQNVVRKYYDDFWGIDCDSLSNLVGIPVEELNCDTAFAVDKLSEHGILPWHLNQVQSNLTRAFEEENLDRILRISAEFGHYIADAHVPLHTTENYNGQLTGQKGIHAFWETRLPQLFYDDYDLWVGKAAYIDNPSDYFWEIVLESHTYVDSVLLIEKDLRETLSEDQLYCYEERYGNMAQIECREFSRLYHERMNGMVESRLRKAIIAVSSAWYTAWLDAGQPDLRKLLEADYANEIIQDSLELEQKFRLGKIFGRRH
jgi:hypothetical protein